MSRFGLIYCRSSIVLPPPSAHVQLPPGLVVQFAHLRHPRLGFLGGNERLRRRILLGRKIAHFLRDLHRAEFGPAHRTEMRGLGAFRRQGLIVVLLRRVKSNIRDGKDSPRRLDALR